MRRADMGQLFPAGIAAVMYTAARMFLRGGMPWDYLGYALALLLMIFFYMTLGGLYAGAGAALLGAPAAPAFAEGFERLRWPMLLLGLLATVFSMIGGIPINLLANIFSGFLPADISLIALQIPGHLFAPFLAMFLPAMAVGHGKLIRPLRASLQMGWRDYRSLWPAIVFSALTAALPEACDLLYLAAVGARYGDLPPVHPFQIITVIVLLHTLYFQAFWSMRTLYALTPTKAE